MKIPKTPIEFDYDLWTTEDGKCMVRVKATKEECEVSREAFRLLRAEEKKVRRSMTGVPASECVQETTTLLSLDYVSYEGGEDMDPAWLEDSYNMEEEIMTAMVEKQFLSILSPYQREVYETCMKSGVTCKAFAEQHGNSPQGVHQTICLIRKQAKKFFK
ncbi:MAG: hypothetical protein Q4F17_10230 [Eubacteriales bacterium]|nr:hypothetical protein [Eubacteriales bacterium]